MYQWWQSYKCATLSQYPKTRKTMPIYCALRRTRTCDLCGRSAPRPHFPTRSRDNAFRCGGSPENSRLWTLRPAPKLALVAGIHLTCSLPLIPQRSASILCLPLTLQETLHGKHHGLNSHPASFKMQAVQPLSYRLMINAGIHGLNSPFGP